MNDKNTECFCPHCVTEVAGIKNPDYDPQAVIDGQKRTIITMERSIADLEFHNADLCDAIDILHEEIHTFLPHCVLDNGTDGDGNFHARIEFAGNEIKNLATSITVLRRDNASLVEALHDLEYKKDAALSKLREVEGTRFPIMGGPSIPWRMIAPHDGQAKINHDQTLERLAERGGLSPEEAIAVLDDLKYRASMWSVEPNAGAGARAELERRREAFENPPAIAAARESAVRGFAEWLDDQCSDQSVWIKDDETEDDTHTTFRSEYPPSVTTRTLEDAAARYLAQAGKEKR